MAVVVLEAQVVFLEMEIMAVLVAVAVEPLVVLDITLLEVQVPMVMLAALEVAHKAMAPAEVEAVLEVLVAADQMVLSVHPKMGVVAVVLKDQL